MHPQNSLEVNELIDYKIPFKGLGLGEHDYQFHITGKFFEAMQSDTDYNCDFNVDLILTVESNMIILDFEVDGHMIFPCDVCTEEYRQPIKYNHRVIVKQGDEESVDDDIIYISPGEYRIDVSQIIYEDIVLNIPLRRVHPDDKDGNPTCNREALDLIEKYHNQKGTDHRWDALKDLKFDD